MERTDVEAWVNGYVEAWTSNDPDAIGALFTEDATYRTSPVRAPWVGRDTIVFEWLGRRDEPGTWTFSFEVIAVDGNLGISRGRTSYQDGPSYANLWLIELEDGGQARSFTEWFMRETKDD